MESELIQALAAIKDSIDAAAQPRTIDWLAIGMSFISIVVSCAAIWVAVHIPGKIADRQDQIELFEKRYAFYNCLIKCDTFRAAVENSHDIEEIKLCFLLVFGEKQIFEGNQKILEREKIMYLHQAKNILRQGMFLFDFETEKWVRPLIKTLVTIITLDDHYDQASVVLKKCEYQRTVIDIEEHLIDQVRQTLKLQREQKVILCPRCLPKIPLNRP